MRLDILGSSGTAPRRGNPASGYLIRTSEATIWMDAGPGTYMALLEMVEPTEIDAVLLSHMHPDHCTDVFALAHALGYVLRSTEPVPVIVPEGSIDRLRGFVGGAVDHQLFATLSVHEARPGETFVFGDVGVAVDTAHHSIPALVSRLSSGAARLGYTGDTGPSEVLAAHVAGVDVLLAEASLDDESEPYPFHMTAREAGALAAEADVGRLLLTHIPESIDAAAGLAAAADRYGGPVGLAAPGETYMIGSANEKDA